jgi:glycosyltransferase involved in cell wall biosynthesis
MFNSNILSFYTPDVLQPSNKKVRQELENASNKGERIAKTQNVVICALLRDVVSKIPEIKRKAERVGQLFKNYTILIVENDSTDGTREALLQWASSNPRVFILGCGINENECKMKKPKTIGHGIDSTRIQKMVDLRNIYLSFIKENYMKYQWDYTIMWDLDLIGSVYLDGITHSINLFGKELNKGNLIDAICAYGIYRWGPLTIYYDTYAHIDHGDDFHVKDKIYHDIRKGLFTRYSRGDTPLNVVSCFSGFTIYRTLALIPKKVVYDMTPINKENKDSKEQNIECEHARLSYHLNNVIMNPSMINLVMLND